MKIKSITIVLALLLSCLSVTTTASAANNLPSAPTSLLVLNATAHSVEIQWDAPADLGGSDLTDYVVSVSRDSGATWRNAINLNFDDLTVTTQSQSINTLDDYSWLRANTTLQIKVAAKNINGQGDYSSLVATTTLKGVPLGRYPVTVSDKFGRHGGLQLSWQAPIDNGGSKILAYKVKYRAAGKTPGKAGTGPYKLIKKLGAKVFNFETPKLARGKNWEVDVTAVNAIGESAGYSTVVDIAKNGKMTMFY